MRGLWAVLGALVTSQAIAHGISPTRVEAPSGSPLVAFRFNAINNGASTEVYSIRCFKHDLYTPYPCNHSPQMLMMRAGSSRSFRAQIETNGDGLYFVCTRQEPKDESQTVVTQVCARVGVGVPASTRPAVNR
jgi:hypothetical protein